MGAIAWIEVLDRRGHVRERHRVEALPALIGRSYGSDVLLDDPWISPIHVRLYRDLDGSLKVEDAGSENGLWSPDRPGRVTMLPLGDGLTLLAGQTTFRIRPHDASVAATLPADAAAPAASGWERWWVGISLAALAGVASGVSQLIGDPEEHRMAQVAGDALAMMLAIAMWAGIWALATRATWHRARFMAHYTVASAATLAIMAIVYVAEYATFLAPGLPEVEGVVALVGMVAAIAMIYGHLSVATALPRLRIAAISTLVIVGLGTIGVLVSDKKKDDDGSPAFSAMMKPIRADLIPVQDTAAFFGGLQVLKDSVDVMARDSE